MEVFLINTFTSEKYNGNPAAICVTNESLLPGKALSLAKEYNLPVTAFVEYDQPDQKLFPIHYFTPTQEIPACGHATLAAAKSIADMFSISDPAFKTIENIILQTQVHDDIVTMTYPKYELIECHPSYELLQSLQLDSFSSAGLCSELETLFIELNDPAFLRSIKPDFAKLVASNDAIIEVVITSVSDDDHYDFLLRSFCPWIGIDEDPVTGSVHSVLAGFWKERFNKTNLKAHQASHRGGEVFVTAFPDKVHIGGRTTRVSIANLA